MYPHERSLVKKLEGKPFTIVGVNSDPKDRARKAAQTEKMAYRSFWDGGTTGGPISTKWGVEGWPTLYLIDAKGVIRQKWLGSPGDEVLDGEIDRLVKAAESERPAGK